MKIRLEYRSGVAYIKNNVITNFDIRSKNIKRLGRIYPGIKEIKVDLEFFL